jgi:hypothetical protein
MNDLDRQVLEAIKAKPGQQAKHIAARSLGLTGSWSTQRFTAG